MLLCFPALGAPWAEVGDKQLREDVELLMDVGILPGPALSWPLPWEQIAGPVIEAGQAGDISPFLQAAARRIRARMQAGQGAGLRPDIALELRATNEAALVRDFSDSARSDADASIRFTHDFEETGTGLSYGVGYQDNQSFQGTKFGGKLNLDNLYVTQKLGNWLLYAGTIEQWWGPSGEQSLILSNSARPYPKVGIKRIQTTPFESKWLRWIGPWRFETSIGVQDGPRNDFANPFLFAQRLELAPFKHFQMGFARVSQLCGRTRPCGAGTFFKAFLPVTGNVNTGVAETDFVNSVATIDLRYARPVGHIVINTYAQFFAEDSVFEAISMMGGITITGHAANIGLWRIGGEALDTYSLRLFDSVDTGRQPGSTYRNTVYTDGYSYRGKPIGASVDGDSRLYSIFGSLTTEKNWRYSSALRYTDINLFNTGNYRISRTREKIWIGEAKLDMPTKFGDVSLTARYQSDRPNTPAARKGQAQFELGWKTRF